MPEGSAWRFGKMYTIRKASLKKLHKKTDFRPSLQEKAKSPVYFYLCYGVL